MTPVLELHGIGKRYAGPPPTSALADVDLTVRRGEFVGIVGPSGSGKSTLLNLVGALDRPTEGTLRIDGHDVATLNDRRLSALRGRRIGFVFQAFNLVDGLDATDKWPPETKREWGEKIRMSDDVIRTVTEKWAKLGLPGSGKAIWK